MVDKYMGLMYLKSHFEHFEDTIPVIVTAIMYEIATTTSVLGEKMEPNFLKLINNEDFVFATCVFARHLDIVKVNRLNVSCWMKNLIFYLLKHDFSWR